MIVLLVSCRLLFGYACNVLRAVRHRVLGNNRARVSYRSADAEYLNKRATSLEFKSCVEYTRALPWSAKWRPLAEESEVPSGRMQQESKSSDAGQSIGTTLLPVPRENRTPAPSHGWNTTLTQVVAHPLLRGRQLLKRRKPLLDGPLALCHERLPVGRTELRDS